MVNMNQTIGIDPGSNMFGVVSDTGVLLAGGIIRGTNKHAQLFGWVFTIVMKYPTALFVIEEPGRLLGRSVMLWEYVGACKCAVQHAGGRWVGISPAEGKQASGLKGNAPKANMRPIAYAAGVLAASDAYWLALGYTSLQATDMSETVSDAYFLALAGQGKVARS